jgi:hypothetical protein
MHAKLRVDLTDIYQSVKQQIEGYKGTTKIIVLRTMMSKIANVSKRILRSAVSKHFKTGLLYTSVSYRVRFYRSTETMVMIVGFKSKQVAFDKWGNRQISHKYAHFLTGGRKKAKQLLRQPPYHRRVDPSLPKKYPRTSGPQPKYIDLERLLASQRARVLYAAYKGIELGAKKAKVKGLL